MDKIFEGLSNFLVELPKFWYLLFTVVLVIIYVFRDTIDSSLKKIVNNNFTKRDRNRNFNLRIFKDMKDNGIDGEFLTYIDEHNFIYSFDSSVIIRIEQYLNRIKNDPTYVYRDSKLERLKNNLIEFFYLMENEIASYTFPVQSGSAFLSYPMDKVHSYPQEYELYKDNISRYRQELYKTIKEYLELGNKLL